jgi:hypothetical protein
MLTFLQGPPTFTASELLAPGARRVDYNHGLASDRKSVIQGLVLDLAQAVAHLRCASRQQLDKGDQAELVAQADLLRGIFLPHPHSPTKLSSAWHTPTVVSLAQAIYDERAFDRMPILGDALEDAGCTTEEILEHCRSGCEHVRGCWVVDCLLGKE